MSFHRVVVIGASVGGVTALRTLVGGIPRDFPAPILLVLHIGDRASILPELLAQSGSLPVAHAMEGESLRAGRIFVAPPGVHLQVAGGRIELNRGPKENHARPAIDPLFRSVAIAYGPAAIGVILTGGLDDGSAGLLAVKQCGGVAIVQEPLTAEDPAMPSNALACVEVDYCVPLDAIPGLLIAMAREEAIGTSEWNALRARREMLPAANDDDAAG